MEVTTKKDHLKTSFDYDLAFARNIGWLTVSEQQFLRGKRIAIAGMGGVGGIHLITLARLGVGKFNITDFDHFEIHNFNRQAGAFISTLGQEKIAVLKKMALDINPEINFRLFPNGLTKADVNEFLAGVDLYVDALDFFSLDIRIEVFKRCRELQIPAITAAPLGMGTSYLIFMPNSTPFEKYFNFAQVSPEDNQIRFLIGLNPKMANRHYLVDKNAVDLKNHKGPSTAMACQLCAGVIVTEALKILLRRGPIYPAPHYHLFDPYLCKHTIGWMPFGNRNPLQLIKHFVVSRLFNTPIETSNQKNFIDTSHSMILKILDLARWAPSGDNIQPWRFKLRDDHHITIHVEDSTQDDIYDYHAIPTMTSCGMLLETIKIAASQYSQEIDWTYQGKKNHHHLFDISFRAAKNLQADPLINCIMERSVDRRPYQLRSLPSIIKSKLSDAVGEEFELVWFEEWRDRLKASKLNALASHIRLNVPELFPIHQHVFDTKNPFSSTGIPIAAVGLNKFNQLLMGWGLKSNTRMQLLNALGGILITQFFLDYIPGFYCSSHFILVSKDNSLDDNYDRVFRAGMAMQRFWLTATQLGLVMQPSFAPLAFSYYASHKIDFTKKKSLVDTSQRLKKLADELFKNRNVMFYGRIGYAKHKSMASRSIRKSLNELLLSDSTKGT